MNSRRTPDRTAADDACGEPTPPRSDLPSTPLGSNGDTAPPGTEVRRLTAEGLRRARQFLAHMREHPGSDREPPHSLLFGEACSRPFDLGVRVERRPFRTRREAAEYFAPKFESIRHLVADHAGLWSWLGMFYFADTVLVEDGQVRLSPQDETFVVHREDLRSYQLRYFHYLWGAWRLNEAHGESAAILLDQRLTSFPRITRLSLGSVRRFNSVGIVQLLLRLYTSNGKSKRTFYDKVGGAAHLIRVLDQLERTYDVYGMTPEALVRILPAEFQRWDGQTPAAAERRAPTPAARETSPAYAAPAADPQPDAPVPPSQPVDDALGHLVEAYTRIQALHSGSWVDLRDYLQEDAAAWRAYTTASGAPEPRLFRAVALRRLEDAIQSTGSARAPQVEGA